MSTDQLSLVGNRYRRPFSRRVLKPEHSDSLTSGRSSGEARTVRRYGP